MVGYRCVIDWVHWDQSVLGIPRTITAYSASVVVRMAIRTYLDMLPGVCIPFGTFAIGALRASSEQRCCATFAIWGYYELNSFADVARRLNTIVCGRIQSPAGFCGRLSSPLSQSYAKTHTKSVDALSFNPGFTGPKRQAATNSCVGLYMFA